MIRTPSFTKFVLVAFLGTVLVQNTYARPNNDSPFIYSEVEEIFCPEQALALYKDCYGPVIGCSDCLVKAEKKCNSEFPTLGDDSVNCFDCTTVAGRKCDSARSI